MYERRGRIGNEMMWSQTQTPVTPSLICVFYRPFVPPTYNYNNLNLPSISDSIRLKTTSSITTKLRAALDDTLLLNQNQPNTEVERSVEVLKNAAKTRKVSKPEVLSALSVIEKAKLDPSKFLETLGGSKSPGRTWMLVFTAEKQLEGGRYFPITAVQRFDAEAKRIENGVFLGSLGSITFEGRFSWKNRILAFIFERLNLKVGSFSPLQISLGNKDDSEPNTKSPFFIWFYVDEEIAVARGRSGGTAFWCRCRQVTNP